MKRIAALILVLCLALSASALAAAPVKYSGFARQSSTTLLTDAGKLAQNVPVWEVARWKRLLRNGRLTAERAARLHLWLGEVAIARDQDPERAMSHFRHAQRFVRRTDPVYGCAAFDGALTLFFHGAYAQAAPAFHELLRPRSPLRGYNRLICALWYRHASVCTGYHARHARLGITEPPSLDPLCGVSALAACLRAHDRPYDRRTLLTHCRITGLGNGFQDLVQCAKRLGMSAQMVKSDDEGLQALPKPLVAYVEQDHFVAVTRADQKGVSYLCSDCGAWPGGRRDLTWKQWRAMDCNLYMVVTRPGSPDDAAVRSLRAEGDAPHPPARQRARLAGYHTPRRLDSHLDHLLGTHVLLYLGPVAPCVPQPNSPQPTCPLYRATYGGSGSVAGGYGSGPGGTSSAGTGTGSSGANSIGVPGASPTGFGGTQGDPVDLATGQEDYQPEPDLTVYNPSGPSVVWRRMNFGLRPDYQVPAGLYPYAQFGFGDCWNTAYDRQVVVANNQAFLFEPNGAAFAFNTPATPTAANPEVSCPSASPGVPMLCLWTLQQDGSDTFDFTQTDRSHWIFSSANGYALTRLVDCNGNYINFVYITPGSSPGFELSAITDSNNQPLITIQHNANFNVTSVSDRYRRSVYYKYRSFINAWHTNGSEVVEVSQVVRTGTRSAAFRYQLGYQEVVTEHPELTTDVEPFLHTITVPSPSGRGLSTTTINYDGFYVGNIKDGNGNTTTFTPIDTNDTQVTVTDAHNNIVYSFTVSFDGQMRLVTRTDGSQTVVSQAAYHPDNPFQPNAVTDGNNQTTTYTYDPFGQVQSILSPRGVVTAYTIDYSVFLLGEVKQIQVGSKSPIGIAYFEPSGLVQAITTPQPGTAGSGQTVTTRFAYDALGNVLTIQRPGNGTVASITTTLNYKHDGGYQQPAMIGQPLSVTDNLGHVTHRRYDARGNLIRSIDALGNETDSFFNIADQRVQESVPAIGDITNLLGVARSSLAYNAAKKTYDGTLTLSNIGSQAIQGYVLAALTNLAPGVKLANAAGTYVNSPSLLSGHVNLVAGAKVVLNVSFKAVSASAVNYGVQTYLTDANGNPAVLSSHTRYGYLYPGGPLLSVGTYDEAGTLYREIRYGYGKEGELLSVSGSTEPVTYGYDAAYRLQTLMDGNGNATHYAYNLEGWLEVVTYPRGDHILYAAYDPEGHLLKRIDGRGIETDYTYNDPESKLTNVQYVNNANYPNASQYNVSIGYDGYGRTQDVYDFSGHTHLDYDDLDSQTEIDTTYAGAGGKPLPTVALTYGFNPDGSRQSMNLQTESTAYDFTYTYDGAGRPQSLTNPFSETTQWSYLNNNWLAAQQYSNGVLCQYAYNRRGFLNDLTHYAPNGSLLSEFGAMVYDVAANRLTKAVTIPGAPSGYTGQTTYAYDIKNQLKQEQSTLLGGYTENFNYDPAGNPLSFKGTAHQYNADNQFADSGFSYDGEGNPTTYGGTTLTFDPEDHMIAVGSVLTAGYRYDGLRALKQTTHGTTYFIYDGITPVLELDGTGSMTAINTFGANGLISRYTSSTDVFYICDPQGSVVQRLDANASSFSCSLFDAFGLGSSTVAVSDPFGYGAQWSYYTDRETSACSLGHRYYDPSMGRFVNRDPISYRGGYNLYGYVANRPSFLWDSSGYVGVCYVCNGSPTYCNWMLSIGPPIPQCSSSSSSCSSSSSSSSSSISASGQIYIPAPPQPVHTCPGGSCYTNPAAGNSNGVNRWQGNQTTNNP